MKNFGFIKVASAIPTVKIADCKYNTAQILSLIKKAEIDHIQIISFPELCITAYTCGDLFHQQLLIKSAREHLSYLLEETKNSEIVFIAGLPVMLSNRLFNAAAICQSGKILGVVPKTYLPNHNEYSENRWFTSGKDATSDEISLCGQRAPFGSNILFSDGEVRFAVEIGEDLWVPQSPSAQHALNGAQLIFNLSAENELTGKNSYLKQTVAQQSAKCVAGYVYCSAGFGESSTDLVFTGNGLIAENGTFLAGSNRFSFEEQIIASEIDIERLNSDRLKNSGFTQENPYAAANNYRTVALRLPVFEKTALSRTVNPYPFVPPAPEMKERCEEIFAIQASGLATRLFHTNIKQVVLGISGGLDSTLALLVCVKTFDKLNIPRKNITGITMPGFGTTGRTYNNALQLMRSLGVSIREISIKAACEQHFKDIGHDPSVADVTFENAQARERTQILMDYANQVNGLVIGTGDLSELALGWTTYNGDHISMYGVNASIPKTLLRHLVRYAAETSADNTSKATLSDIIDTPVSPELLPVNEEGKCDQNTENLVGPYELHDFLLYYTIRFGFSPAKIFFLATQAFENRYSREIIKKWMRVFFSRFFSQQFKRSCSPDAPKVGSVSLSPRGDWRMPSDASSEEWLNNMEN
ncbi:MAG: NAD(+) synthase [Prevotellaceae bacterium]|jgi:NAD+ synthase (glutamine-hydrolysing)|nr:NAD(+) synthase [Prevotellaceae bacterium]